MRTGLKKIISLVLFIVMITALAACTPTQPAESGSKEQASPAESGTESGDAGSGGEGLEKVAYIPGDMANESQAFSAKMFKKHAAEYGFDVAVLDGKADAQVQAQLVNNAIAQDMKAIFLNPNDINAIIPSLDSAKKAGLIVGLYSSDLPEEARDCRDFFVGVNDNEAGESAAQAFLDAFPNGAKIVEIGGQAGHDAQIKRHDGFNEKIQGTNIEVIAYQATSAWSTAEAMAIMEDFIVKYGDEIDGVFCHWDNGATGVIEAIKAANLNKDIYIVAVDGCRAGFDQVKDGTQAVTVMQDFEAQAVKALEVTRAILDGKDYEELNFVPLNIVTIDNIDDYPYPEW